MAITEFSLIRNLSGDTVHFKNFENSGDNQTLFANTDRSVAVWVPWADNGQEFNQHRIEVHLGARRLYVWQAGERVRYSETGWDQNAAAVPGNSDVGGKRTLIIDAATNPPLSME